MFLLHYCLHIFETAVESVKMLGPWADINMAAFVRWKVVVLRVSSCPSGHSWAQMKITSIRQKAFFFVLFGGLLFNHGRLYLTYLKKSSFEENFETGLLSGDACARLFDYGTEIRDLAACKCYSLPLPPPPVHSRILFVKIYYVD